MEQKFVSFEEAIEKLGVSADRLNEMRESGQLRAYRDGASWKFRRDEIDKYAVEGLPEPPPPSDIGLAKRDELVESEPITPPEDEDELKLGDLDLDDELHLDESSLDLGGPEMVDTDPVSPGTELELVQDADDDSTEAESILLSEEELGESVGPASTIIGKDELADADLELAPEEPEPHQSDVRLESEITKEQPEAASLSAFEDLAELEIDLSAESSRILSPEEAEQAKAAAPKDDQAESSLTLEDEDDILGEDDAMGSTDVSALQIDPSGESKVKDDAEIELEEDDDLILSDGSGSDVTLDPSESGINLEKPSDSGLALDDITLDAGSSAILSSLSLSGEGEGESDLELSLLGSDAGEDESGGSQLQEDDDFRLTPMGDAEEDESSSQVIALDADLEEIVEEDVADLGDDAFLESESEGVALVEDYTGEEADSLGGPSYGGSAAPAAAESPYSLANNLGLGAVAILLCLSGLMMVDMVRNIWSWDQAYALNSSLIETLLGLFGLG